MTRTKTLAAALALCTATLGAATSFGAATAQADPLTDTFLRGIAGQGLDGIDPATAISVGQQVCPLLAQPGQDLADVAAGVSDSLGRPLGPATLFTGVAISVFCPGAVAALGSGQSPLPMDLLGALL